MDPWMLVATGQSAAATEAGVARGPPDPRRALASWATDPIGPRSSRHACDSPPAGVEVLQLLRLTKRASKQASHPSPEHQSPEARWLHAASLVRTLPTRVTPGAADYLRLPSWHPTFTLDGTAAVSRAWSAGISGAGGRSAGGASGAAWHAAARDAASGHAAVPPAGVPAAFSAAHVSAAHDGSLLGPWML